MELMQDIKISLHQPIEGSRLVSIDELEKELQFDYLPHLSFKDYALRRKLLNEGLEQKKRREIPEDILNHGIKWKQEIESGYIPKVSVRFLGDEFGYGIFAEEDLGVGDYVGEYTGHVRENNEHLTINNYLYSYPLLDDIRRNYVIDATSGNLMRFVNHSTRPNLKPFFAFVDGFYHMVLITLAPISKGSQLAYNYGKNYWIVRSKPKELLQ